MNAVTGNGARRGSQNLFLPYVSLSKERAVLGVDFKKNFFFNQLCSWVCHFWKNKFLNYHCPFKKNLFSLPRGLSTYSSLFVKIFQFSHYSQCLEIKDRDNRIKQQKKKAKENSVMIFTEMSLPYSISICPKRASPKGNLNFTIICVLSEVFKYCFSNVSIEIRSLNLHLITSYICRVLWFLRCLHL